MATVGELTEPYGSFLVHPLPPGTGVCATCRTAVTGTYTRCYQCNEALRSADGLLADVVVPISIAVKGEQLAAELWRYKNLSDPEARSVLRLRLAAVLWRFLDGHEACVASAVDVPRFSVVTSVPSTSGRNNHPLRQIVERIVVPTRDRYRDLLTPNSSVPSGRDVRVDRFLVRKDANLSGVPVLLIDDTWTTGGHAQSAAVALKQAGAARVAVVVIGRHFDPSFGDNLAYLRSARKVRFSWDYCCVHNSDL
jgi:hypothetical protein